MSIIDWPEIERPREKLLSLGAAALSDAELLAIFLRTGCAGKSAVDLARDLLNQYQGLRPLLESSQKEFCKTHGLGPAKYSQLQAVLEMARRHLASNLKERDVLSNPTAVKTYVSAQLRHQQREVFAVLFLDSQNRLLAYEELFSGGIDGATIYPREIIRRVISYNAAAVIVAHNHPSGVAEPSQSDIRVTHRLAAALSTIDVGLLDHLVVGDAHTVSFAERGLI